MIKKLGMTFGGLQQKILNLVLIFILALIALFISAAVYSSVNLGKIVDKSSDKQRTSMTAVSENTMATTLNVSMKQSSDMQASIADAVFSEAMGDVLFLREYAQYLFSHPDEYEDLTVDYPDPANDGTASIQLQHEAAVDPEDDDTLGLAANMGEILLARYRNSEVLNSCFIATANGSIIFVDDRAAANFDMNGVLQTFEVRERPWYIGAVQTGDLYFTGIELDAFTNIPGIVCSAPVYADGKLVAVVGADIFLHNISEFISDSVKYGGFVCIINKDGEIVFSPKNEGTFKASAADESVDLRNIDNKELADYVSKAVSVGTDAEEITVDGVPYYLCATPMDTVEWTVVSVIEKEISDKPTKTLIDEYDRINEEAQNEYDEGAQRVRRSLLLWIAVMLVLASIAALLVAGRIVKPIEHMTKRMQDLNGTDLAFEMEDAYRTGDEVEMLAEGLAELSSKTRRYIDQITKITAEKQRIGTELELATKIQADMLPNIFPAFPERPEFDIHATMTPAKEVGGDFYDFFLIDDDHLGLVIADVSGKGVPAALFMMMSKILVGNFAMTGISPAKVLEQVNTQICLNNDEEMFVTVWFGILEISTGKVTAANAGHEYPMIKKANGEFELFRDKHGFVIGGMEGIKYKEYEFTLEKGGTLFLYTDGVAEATDPDNKLFGTERMLDALNIEPEASPKTLLSNMKKAVDDFVGDAPQFDDLTMLGVKLL